MDDDLNKLLKEVRAIDSDFYLKKMEINPKKRFLKKRLPSITLYELLYDYSGFGECQVVNFSQENSGGINTCVSKSYIETFFLGWLGGYEQGLENKK